ncbi:hypothetical protein FHS85_003233 [Rhodoligotrophos appendicifer]|uniref:ROK family protein n=1 Tax=Rhodoligotrophos appendicifer TaxID=987056 RepID=UPI00195FF3EB|nr:ROK family protein [Rhodoligotrophos appendicifer]
MAKSAPSKNSLATGIHAAVELPAVFVDKYNIETKDDGEFIGDRVSGRAFRRLLDERRKALAKHGPDPLGEQSSAEVSKKKLDKILLDGDPKAASVIIGVVADFGETLADVIRRFRKTKDWNDVSSITVGGGLRQSRIGELIIGRAATILQSDGVDIDMFPIQHHPDQAGLIGAVQLTPPWMLSGFDEILAVDVGGSNIRAGIIALNGKKAPDFSAAEVTEFEHWRHAEDDPNRQEAIDRLVDMLKNLIRKSKRAKRKLAPMIGVGCPGAITPDGQIQKGGQNLPGNWESSRFNLPDIIEEKIPTIGEHETFVVMHNDAVVQGLSQVPFMRDHRHWAVLTMGTGLGNAVFTNKDVEKTK